MEINISNLADNINDLISYGKYQIGSWNNDFNLTYGDYGRIPNKYLRTHTKIEKNFIGNLANFPPSNLKLKNYQNFPQVSISLLQTLFSKIGVEYVPEITLIKLQKQKPFEVFQSFCTTFSNQGRKINGKEINRVVLKLKEMDSLRNKYALNSQPIYRELAHLNFREADRLIHNMRERISELEKLENSKEGLSVEIKEENIKFWNGNQYP